MCKVVPYIQGVSVAASVYSLCAVSIDRYVLRLSLPICIFLFLEERKISDTLFFSTVSFGRTRPIGRLFIYILIAHTLFGVKMCFRFILLCHPIPSVCNIIEINKKKKLAKSNGKIIELL